MQQATQCYRGQRQASFKDDLEFAMDRLTRDVKEVEAELTAYLTKSALGQTQNLEYSRGYIQNWVGDGTVEKVRFGKVFGAADAILKAGRLEPDRPAGGTEHSALPARLES